MDVIASTAFGIRVESQKDRNNAFVTHGKKAFEVDIRNPMVLIRSKFLFMRYCFCGPGIYEHIYIYIYIYIDKHAIICIHDTCICIHDNRQHYEPSLLKLFVPVKQKTENIPF